MKKEEKKKGISTSFRKRGGGHGKTAAICQEMVDTLIEKHAFCSFNASAVAPSRVLMF